MCAEVAGRLFFGCVGLPLKPRMRTAYMIAAVYLHLLVCRMCDLMACQRGGACAEYGLDGLSRRLGVNFPYREKKKRDKK